MRTLRSTVSMLCALVLTGVFACILFPLKTLAGPILETVYEWPQEAPELIYSELMEASDGYLYGTSVSGGMYGKGFVFRLSKGGTLTRLVDFSGDAGGNPGTGPLGSLCEGADGALYGFSQDSIFKVSKSGSMQKLHGNLSPGYSYIGQGFAVGSDGALYSVLQDGIVRMDTDGGLQVVANLKPLGGWGPVERLTADGFGNLFGIIPGGGRYGRGCIFKFSSGGKLSVEFEEFPSGMADVTGPLVISNQGDFYAPLSQSIVQISKDGIVRQFGTGDTSYGMPSPLTVAFGEGVFGLAANSYNYGGGWNSPSLFEITADGPHTLHIFPDWMNGMSPSMQAGLARSSDGYLYGLEVGDYYKGIRFFRVGQDRVVQPIRSFSRGAVPYRSGLQQATDGYLYGASSDNGSPLFPGSYFRVGLDGKMESVSASSGNLAVSPTGGLLEVSSTFLGCARGANGEGYIVSFSGLNPPTVLCALPSEMSGLEGSLLKAQNGSMYGATAFGGTNNKGTILKAEFTGGVSTVVAFSGTAGSFRGESPCGELLQTNDGSLWGVTRAGGASNLGTVFQISPQGDFTTIVEFTGTSGACRGAQPMAGLVSGTDGDLYGTTERGGQFDAGTVFKVQTNSTLVTLAEFSGTMGHPSARLLWHDSGFFFGSCSYPGSVFKISPNGTLSVVGAVSPQNSYVFSDSLVAATDGNLYGTTASGGAAGVGSLIRLHFGPTPITGEAQSVTGSSAVLTGTVNPNGNSSSAYFQWGTDPTFVSKTDTATVLVASGTSGVLVQASLNGLVTGTTYYYRVVATNPENPALQMGNVRDFTPSAQVPAAVTGVAQAVDPTTAILTGTISGGADCAATFEIVAATGTFGGIGSKEILVPGNLFDNPSAQTVSAYVPGLLAHTAYKFRVRSKTPTGSALGDPVQFSTGNRMPIASDVSIYEPRMGYQSETVFGIATNAADLDGDALTITGVTYSGSSVVVSSGTTVSYQNTGFSGTETLLVHVADGFGGNATSLVTIFTSREEEWRADHFGDQRTDPAAAGDLADPDGDGLVNVLERVLHGDPNHRDSDKRLVMSGTSGRLSLDFSTGLGTGVVLVVQGSSDISDPLGWVDLAESYEGGFLRPLVPGVNVQSDRDEFACWIHHFTDLVTVSGTVPQRFLRILVEPE